jgi:hypothetical protein
MLERNSGVLNQMIRIGGYVPVLGIVVASLLFGSSPAVSAQPRPNCQTVGRTVVANSVIRVFRIRRQDQTDVYACSLSGGPRRWLATGIGGAGGPARFRLAGRLVAYADASCSSSGCNARVLVVNVKTNRTAAFPQPPDTRGITDLELSDSGRPAWIRRRSPAVGGPFVEVVVAVGSNERVIDSSPDIAPQSLATSSGTFYWLHGRSAVNWPAVTSARSRAIARSPVRGWNRRANASWRAGE